MTGDSTSAADRVARLTAPPLDEGPHLNYAFQWFGFALVTLVGVGYIVKQGANATSKIVAPPINSTIRDRDVTDG
jgi:cytochrome oxidase assembly protein ShyY1